MAPAQPPDVAPASGDLETAFEKAVALYGQGQLPDAESICRQILTHQPASFDALHLLSVILLQSQRPQEAEGFLKQAVQVNPDHADVRCHLGSALQILGRDEEAIVRFSEALERDPGSAMAFHNRGVAYKSLQQFDLALADFDKALTFNPNYLDAHNHRGLALYALRKFDSALEAFDMALRLNPKYAKAHLNRGLSLWALEQLDAALECFDQVIELEPNAVDGYVNRANLLADLGRTEDAVSGLLTAQTLAPEHPVVGWNLGLFRLLTGRLEDGFSLFEWRHKTPNARPPQVPDQAPWTGQEALAGKTLYVYWEQGFGDTIQMYRYVRLLSDQGVEITLQVQKPLVALLQAADERLNVIGPDDAPGAFDHHCPILSLPHAFRTGLETIPAPQSYLHSDPALRQHWSKRLGPDDRPRVGLVWNGSADHENDQKRSMALATMLEVMDPAVSFIALQNEIREADATVLEGDGRLTYFGDAIRDFRDTAALVDLMDLVITVDTSAAHLAGALGKPVWILLPFKPDWRWLLARDDSPWYPTARLFRQEVAGDWPGVIRRVSRDLARQISEPATHARGE